MVKCHQRSEHEVCKPLLNIVTLVLVCDASEFNHLHNKGLHGTELKSSDNLPLGFNNIEEMVMLILLVHGVDCGVPEFHSEAI